MRVFAPGKLVLAGAYAVLEGAPAICAAVSRGAFADDALDALLPTPEVLAAFGDGVAAPHVDASSMFVGARKLGLGASAAILVASMAVRDARDGADLGAAAYREGLFARAREAHAKAQSGGSGVDVAASVHGGVIAYTIGGPTRQVALPPGLHVEVHACATSARTSELRAEVEALARTNPPLYRACIAELVMIAESAAAAVDAGDGPAFVASLRRTARGLDRLGTAARVALVPPGFDMLEEVAAREGASFSVSGAGGGDVAVYVGPRRSSAEFLERERALGLFPLDIAFDHEGVRTAPPLSTSDLSLSSGRG